MTRTRITRIARIVFLLWLIVSIALVVSTTVALLPLPDQRPKHKETGNIRLLLANGDQQPQCFPSAEPRSHELFRCDCPWLLKLTSTVLTVPCTVFAPSLNFQ